MTVDAKERDAPGTDDEFTQWIDPWLADLRRFAMSLTTVDDAEDLVQDTLTRAWLKRSLFRADRGSAKSWLMAIMADQARRRWTRRPPELRLERAAPHDEPSAVGVDLRRAVDALPRRQRMVIALFYYFDLGVADVAQVLDCSPGTVKSTLHDARNRLHITLGDDYA